MKGTLILEDGTKLEGTSFGAQTGRAGEVVFSTGMVGYPESFTDPSYYGQILILTYPIMGNYGVPHKRSWESDRVQISGLVVSQYIDTPSHFQSKQTLSSWLKEEKVPAIEIIDTRLLTQKIREKGAMLGKIVFDKEIPNYDPNQENVVAKVSIKKLQTLNKSSSKKRKHILLLDCGMKRNIPNCLVKRDVTVTIAPWDYNPFRNGEKFEYDAILISNGPGDPVKTDKTIETVRIALENKIPTLGVCLGNQILALAAGGKTYKLKFGHRSQNQPCILQGSSRCYITTQNHGFAVSDELPSGFKPWFVNANDGSNEGIMHTKQLAMSSQFHPEATPGPMDTEWIFDYFLEKLS